MTKDQHWRVRYDLRDPWESLKGLFLWPGSNKGQEIAGNHHHYGKTTNVWETLQGNDDDDDDYDAPAAAASDDADDDDQKACL